MEYPRPVKYDTPNLGMVLRLVSTERLVPDALLKAEARIRWLEFQRAEMIKHAKHLDREVLHYARRTYHLEDLLRDARSNGCTHE